MQKNKARKKRSKSVSVRFSPDQLELIRQGARIEDRSLNKFIIRACVKAANDSLQLRIPGTIHEEKAS